MGLVNNYEFNENTKYKTEVKCYHALNPNIYPSQSEGLNPNI